MNDVVHSKVDRIDHFFSAPSARNDRWREINSCAKAWAAGQADRGGAEAALRAAASLEEFHAFPGSQLLSALYERLEKDDAKGFASLARRISVSIAARSYKDDPSAWQTAGDAAEAPADVLPPTLGAGEHARPFLISRCWS